LTKEVFALERLRGNKGIPSVLDHNSAQVEDKNTPLFLVTERVEGVTLVNRFHQPLELENGLGITARICELVRLCHRENVIHRDIKPDNIIIDPNTGDISLIDFGEAWTEDIIGSLETHVSEELGNRFLRLPEMMSGSERKDDPRSDLTFVCGILFWLLTQKKPIQPLNDERKAPHYAMANRFSPAVISDRRWPFVQSIFDVGFSIGLGQRYQTADDLLKALNEALNPVFPNRTDSERAKEELAKLKAFYNRAEIAAEDAIQQSMNQASTLLLNDLKNLARSNNLFCNSTLPGQIFRFLLKFRESDRIWVDVSHWVRLVGPNRSTEGKLSYVEACYAYVNFVIDQTVPEPYYTGPSTDFRRLEQEVQKKSGEIFADLVARLRQQHERRD
jgi:serine/threonine protein kinase